MKEWLSQRGNDLLHLTQLDSASFSVCSVCVCLCLCEREGNGGRRKKQRGKGSQREKEARRRGRAEGSFLSVLVRTKWWLANQWVGEFLRGNLWGPQKQTRVFSRGMKVALLISDKNMSDLCQCGFAFYKTSENWWHLGLLCYHQWYTLAVVMLLHPLESYSLAFSLPLISSSQLLGFVVWHLLEILSHYHFKYCFYS